MENLELSMNGEIITVVCNDKGDLGMITKDELEEYIQDK